MSVQIQTTRRRIGIFRGAMFVLAFFLTCQAIWILAAELSRPPHFGFPADAQAAEAAAGNRDAAALAASLGIFRGDLWAEYSLTYLNLFWRGRQDTATGQSSTIEQARDAAIRTLRIAPHDARVWLALSSTNLRNNGLNREGAALQMSYFTGANETELVPLRLRLALRSNAITEKDFQQLVSHDVRTIITRKPELKPAVWDAYRGALPAGRQFLEEVLRDLDPAFLAKLRQEK